MQTDSCPKSWSKGFRPYRMLTDVSNRVVSIRKALRQVFGKTPDRNLSSVMDDAVKNCDLIERLCRRGQTVPAEEVMDYYDLVEVILGRLERQLMTLLASRGKHVLG